MYTIFYVLLFSIQVISAQSSIKYDKIIFEDLKNNVILTAILAYMASEDPETTSREKSVLPINIRSGKQMKWPKKRSPNRKGGI